MKLGLKLMALVCSYRVDPELDVVVLNFSPPIIRYKDIYIWDWCQMSIML